VGSQLSPSSVLIASRLCPDQISAGLSNVLIKSWRCPNWVLTMSRSSPIRSQSSPNRIPAWFRQCPDQVLVEFRCGFNQVPAGSWPGPSGSRTGPDSVSVGSWRGPSNVLVKYIDLTIRCSNSKNNLQF
jgi:hypothetical protein